VTLFGSVWQFGLLPMSSSCSTLSVAIETQICAPLYGGNQHTRTGIP
jgi:hypothetical protein